MSRKWRTAGFGKALGAMTVLGGLCLAAPASSSVTGAASPAAAALAQPRLVDSSRALRVAFEGPTSAVPASPGPTAFRIRNDALLSYGAPLTLGESELRYRVRVPGHRHSWVTFELIF